MFSEMGSSTLMMCLFFGANSLLFILFQLIKRSSKVHVEEQTKKRQVKELSKPFNGTIDCFINITTELFRTGIIMALTYICEKHPYFPHSQKSYSRDLFIFVLIIFFAYAIITIKPVHDLSLLGREQTEEWKGWMQFIFLLYHYFHAEEVYNSVRVMITCYVWMTGFGNFSFFYIKRDFGWLRVVQMLWRLNFAVLLLMWTHGNTYILYYICPMHTFYFFLVYVTMFFFSEVNHSKWGIRIKLFIVGVLIFVLWDVNGGMFDILFAWLGTDKVIGATRGSVWEWYFRTSLDKYSTFLGMIFALNFPVAEQFFTRAKGAPMILTATILGSLTLWWFYYYYTLPKLEYNLSHSYFSFIPLLSYIFFRNITPHVRSGVSMSLHELGKTTLETYLLQHHIWLTSNAKTLLTIVPDHPWINFALASILFFFVSRELYRITMSLRGMIMPDDHNLAFRNTMGAIFLFAFLFILALALKGLNPEFIDVCIASTTVFISVLLLINRFAKNTYDNPLYQSFSAKATWISIILIVLGVSYRLSVPNRPMTSLYINPSATLIKPSQLNAKTLDIKRCYNDISKGHWDVQDCPAEGRKSSTAMCQVEIWDWDPDTLKNCPLKLLNGDELKTVFRGKKIAFLGDSQVRNIYHSFSKLADESYVENNSPTQKHVNQKFSTSSNITIEFYWAPFIKDLTYTLKTFSPNQYKAIVLGGALWDALHNHDLPQYSQQLEELSKSKVLSNLGTFSVWVQPTTIVDGRLNSEEKQKYMTEQIIDTYRQAYMKSSLTNDILFTIDPTYITKSQQATASDGVHYTSSVYQVLAQMITNGYLLMFPNSLPSSLAASTSVKKLGPLATGSMGNPFYGFIVLFFSFIMIFTMDNFFGFGVLSLSVFGRSLDWESAYIPLLNKIGISGSRTEGLNSDQGEANIGINDVEGSNKPLLG